MLDGIQTNHQPTNQTFKLVLHQGAYEGMSCYYGFEGYGTGWDPWLGGCYFFKKVASSWLVDVCFLYRA